jgi:hypothetical protein
VFIQNPTRRTILYRGKYYFISLPKLKYKITYNEDFVCLNVFVTCKHPRYDFPANILPNFYWNGNVCLGEKLLRGKNEKDLVSQVVAYIWNSRFSSSAIPDTHFKKLNVKSCVGYFQLWQEKTKADRNWIPGKDFFTIRS